MTQPEGAGPEEPIADASDQDYLVEQTDNSGEPGDDAPQDMNAVQTTDDELDDDDDGE